MSSDPDLGNYWCLCCYSFRNHDLRMENRKNDGFKDRKTHSDRWICCRNSKCNHSLYSLFALSSSFYNSYNHWCYFLSGCCEKCSCREVGYDLSYRLGMDIYYPYGVCDCLLTLRSFLIFYK